jgi:OmpA-OmpF porin, OOP family
MYRYATQKLKYAKWLLNLTKHRKDIAMLKITGQKVLVGLVAGTLLNLAAPVWASGKTETGYVLTSSGPLLGGNSCVRAPNQPKGELFEVCGDSALDSDGDGVPDDKDKCPNTPAGVTVDEHGCPLDSDGDGVPDYLDACPNNTPLEISKGVDANGCPLDTDGDGVPDYRDKCPNTPPDLIHKVDADGCAPVDQIVRLELTTVFFDFDKAALKAEGKNALAALAEQVAKDAYVRKIEIVGHTDNIGTEAYNQVLSEKRARAAADHLVSLGVSPNKIVVIGKGESEAKGRTAAERAKDRRVIVDVHQARD